MDNKCTHVTPRNFLGKEEFQIPSFDETIKFLKARIQEQEDYISALPGRKLPEDMFFAYAECALTIKYRLTEKLEKARKDMQLVDEQVNREDVTSIFGVSDAWNRISIKL